MNSSKYKIPLGLFKQAIMKVDSLIRDIHEIREDADLDKKDKNTLIKLSEMAGIIEASLLNIVRKECDEEDFLNEDVEMDDIDPYPGDDEDIDILDEIIN